MYIAFFIVCALVAILNQISHHLFFKIGIMWEAYYSFKFNWQMTLDQKKKQIPNKIKYNFYTNRRTSITLMSCSLSSVYLYSFKVLSVALGKRK